MDSIDYSPHPSVKKTTLVLHELELKKASPHQFVRFFRVWCVESHTYAPLLESLKIILHPEDGSAHNVGIEKFLQYAMDYSLYKSEELRAAAAAYNEGICLSFEKGCIAVVEQLEHSHSDSK